MAMGSFSLRLEQVEGDENKLERYKGVGKKDKVHLLRSPYQGGLIDSGGVKGGKGN